MKQAIDIFNIFITFGDSFLQSAEQYDRLFYEIIRLEDVFLGIEKFILTFGGRIEDDSGNEELEPEQEQEHGAPVLNEKLAENPAEIFENSSNLSTKIVVNLSTNLLYSLKNIKDIIHHFSPKITNYQKKKQIPSLTESQVLKIVKDNYQTLILSLNDSLELFENIDLIYNKYLTDYDEEEYLLNCSRICLKNEILEFLKYDL